MNTHPLIHNHHLEGGPFFWQGGPVGILLIHGFTATTAEVRLLARRLHKAGYTVSGPLLPGHNTHPDDLNRVRWQEWVQACQDAYAELATCCKTIIIGGESTGGLLSLHLGSQHPEISTLLLYAPALRLNLRFQDRVFLYLAAPFITSVPKKNLDTDNSWQGYRVNPLKGAIQLLKLQSVVKPELSQIKQPILIIQGALDTTVHPGVPDTIFQQVSSQVKEIHWMAKSSHCVILDQELDEVTLITLKFLDENLISERESI
jgi:carboxylesterase